MRQLAQDITDKIHIAAKANPPRARQTGPAPGAPAAPAPAPVSIASLGRMSTELIIFIGASTGGTEATKDVLVNLPADCPPWSSPSTCPGFTRSYAARLDGLCRSVGSRGDASRRAKANRARRLSPRRLWPACGTATDQPPQAFSRSAVSLGRKIVGLMPSASC